MHRALPFLALIAVGALWGAGLPLLLLLAVAGTRLPGISSYAADVHQPTGPFSILLSAVPCSGYVPVVAAAGAVFAGHVSYLVTLFGLFWAMLFLGESYSGAIWGALLMMLAGMALVQPRPRHILVSAGASAKNGRRFNGSGAQTGDVQV